MTYRRRQVLAYYEKNATRDQGLSVCRMARECGIYNYSTAIRIVRDLQRLGYIPDLPKRSPGRPPIPLLFNRKTA